MLKISKMTGKLKHIPAINTNTLSNVFCKDRRETDTVCQHCYSFNMLETFRKSCVDPWEVNSKLLSEGELSKHSLPVVNSAVFRFHGHGELINDTHLINLMNICETNPLTTFSLWTKRPKIVNKVLKSRPKPESLILIYSNPSLSKVLDKVPTNFDKVFNVTKNHTPTSDYTDCTGVSCMKCLACYQKGNGRDIIVEALK